MKEIQLTRNQVTKIDDEDFEEIKKYKWFAIPTRYGSNKFYAARRRDHKTIFLHKVLCPAYPKVDHIDGDSLNNQKSNLRKCDTKTNAQNSSLSKANKSGYKGVSYSKRLNKWRACIRANNNGIHLGYFRSPQEAAEAYNLAATKYFGEFARLNQLQGIT